MIVPELAVVSTSLAIWLHPVNYPASERDIWETETYSLARAVVTDSMSCDSFISITERFRSDGLKFKVWFRSDDRKRAFVSVASRVSRVTLLHVMPCHGHTSHT